MVQNVQTKLRVSLLAHWVARADLEVVGGGVQLPTALVVTAERLLANIRAPRLPVVLIL